MECLLFVSHQGHSRGNFCHRQIFRGGIPPKNAGHKAIYAHLLRVWRLILPGLMRSSDSLHLRSMRICSKSVRRFYCIHAVPKFSSLPPPSSPPLPFSSTALQGHIMIGTVILTCGTLSSPAAHSAVANFLCLRLGLQSHTNRAHSCYSMEISINTRWANGPVKQEDALPSSSSDRFSHSWEWTMCPLPAQSNAHVPSLESCRN